MPRAGVPNNPQGSNGWDGFTSEPVYGAVQRTQTLGKMSPMAGGQVAAGAINAPERAGQAAKGGKKKPPPPPTGGTLFPPTPPPGGVIGPPTGQPPWTVPYPPGTIQNNTWQEILAAPGARRFPLLAYYARAA